MPVKNFWIEVGSALAAHDIHGVPGLEDFRRDSAPFGLTFAVESHLNRIDDTSAAAVRDFAMPRSRLVGRRGALSAEI